MTYTGHSRLADFVRGLGALAVFAFLLVGFPVAMYKMFGSPLPDKLPTWAEISTTLMRPDTDQTVFIATIRLIGWGAWCLFIVTVCAELVRYLRGRSKPAMLSSAWPMQKLIRDLVATATLTFSAAASLASSASAATHMHTATGVQAAADPAPSKQGHSTSGMSTPAPATGASEWTPLLADETPSEPEPDPHPWRTHIVKRGETLWDLARRTYGSGTLYPKIFKTSQDVHQPHGLPELTDPDLVRPGQRVLLPRPGTHEAPSSKTGTRSQHEAGHSSGARQPAPTGSPSSASKPPQVQAPVVAPPAERSGSVAPAAPHHHQDDHHSPLEISLPSGSRIGLGLAAVLSVAVAATRLHRRRRRPLILDPGSPPRPAEEPPIPAPVLKAHQAHLKTHADRGAPVPSDTDIAYKDMLAAHPDQIVLGTRDGNAIAVSFAGLNLGLSGDGGHAVARAITTELLAQARRYRAEVIIPRADAQTLFPGDDIIGLGTELEGLIVTPSLREATDRAEAEFFRRGRLILTSEVSDVPGFRAYDECEPLETILLVASAPPGSEVLSVIAALGRRYCIGVLVLGAWPSGTTVELAADATVTDADGPDAARFTGTRMFHLTADDATDLLRTLRTATGNEPDLPAPPASTDDAPEPEAQPVSAMVPPPRPSGEERCRPARLNVLGHVSLHTPDGPINTGLRQRARDLLAYLSLHPDGVTRDQAIADLWPDESPGGLVAQFNTAVNNARGVLRNATGLEEPKYILHSAGRYRIDSAVLDVDLWELMAALADAGPGTDDDARTEALFRVDDLYTGEFASGLDGIWAQNQREYLRRTIGEALANLARIIQEDDPERALAVLERAIEHDAFAEPLYRHIMRLQARLGRPDAIRRTYGLLEGRLFDIDAEAEEETSQLFHFLLRPSKRG
ncbi:BTAD domain-containing putative transcriptional regulator [Actinomadura violacea]|uniref:LysM peptidoglycan-binding domain-containing protein n=1 Tax=Actinomadura violacea TaxID=2819934 RepID=A0ABS3S7Q5_9ACTN|nr:BTAD domain-containing putative transcriptional regulator [Actinomadura violacea]MBO2465032.1 LysM peptidoglycan-binding domain-containing protein [Actinomadura violacea]